MTLPPPAGPRPGAGRGRRRQDRLTGRWSLVAPERLRRPDEHAHPAGASDAAPCPFCPGAESELAAVLAEAPAPEAPGWRTRAVENRYPAVHPAASPGGREAGEAVGHQEVLVETPAHGDDWPDFDAPRARAALDLYLDRVDAARRRFPDHRVFAFRNRGRDAGSSRAHPHGQLVAVRGCPPAVARLEARQLRHHRATGRCLVCTLPEAEPAAEARTVLETPHHRAFTLWAPADPFHLRIVPRRHHARAGDATEAERADLAGVLVRVLGALRAGAGDPHYNLLFRDGPDADAPHLHAFIEVRPRFGRVAGFEQLTSVFVSPSDPVDDARVLRHALRTITPPRP